MSEINKVLTGKVRDTEIEIKSLKDNLLIFKQVLESVDLSKEEAEYELMELMTLFDKLFKGKI